jgi:hypothetical protein
LGIHQWVKRARALPHYQTANAADVVGAQNAWGVHVFVFPNPRIQFMPAAKVVNGYT